MSAHNTIFVVEDRWGDRIELTDERWSHTKRRHPEIEPYLEQVKQAILHPNLVYQTPHRLPTKSFYAKGLIQDAPYRGCYVAVFVRYTTEPASIRTAYLPVHLSANPGTLLHADL